MPTRPAAPSSPPPSMDHRAPPQRPSAAVVPLRRRRRTPRSPRQAANLPLVPPPAALPVPVRLRSAPRQIPAHPAAAGAADSGNDNLMLLAHTAVSQADAEAEASSSRRPAPPAPARKKLRSAPPLPPAAAADEEKEKPYALPLPPLAVNHDNPPSMSKDHGHAATKATAGDFKKAACPQPQGNAGSSEGDQRGGGVASPAAGSSLPQPGVDDEELELGEIPPEKPAAGCNADFAHESLLGKEEETAAGEEAKATIAAGEPAATGSSSAVVVSTGVVVGKDGKAAATDEMSAAEQKRMREVYVGGLSKDAREEDVRAAFSAAGEITEVRFKKGFCFVAYRDAAMASKAVAEFGDVKICGKPCRVAVPEGNEKTNKITQRDPVIEDYYNRIYEQGQPSPTLAVHSSSYITSWDRHATPASSYVVSPLVAIRAGYYIPMYRHNGNGVYLPPDLNHGQVEPWGSQMGQSGSCRPPAGQPHRSRN